MSLIIKGIEMPKHCQECVLCRSNGEYDYAYCCISSCETSGTARLPDCPLVELPDHGDLIDRGALMNAVPKAEADVFENCGRCTCLDTEQVKEFIADVPVIIPAERSGDGSNR